MRIAFLHSDKPRERILADAFADGARVHGDTVELSPLTPEVEVAVSADVAVMVGVKSRERWHAHWDAGIHVVMLDKGYCRGKGAGPVRGWEYWRISVDGHHPTRYLERMRRPSDRWNRLGIDVMPWRASGEHIILAGSSAKYHDFYGLNDPTAFAHGVVKSIRAATQRAIVYRPKPSWRDAIPITKTRFSAGKEPLAEILTGAHALITHGSNACFEAMLAGVPSIVLGDAVAKPISSTSLDDIEAPRVAGDEERMQLLANLAYAQFTLSEFASGEAWSNTRSFIYG